MESSPSSYDSDGGDVKYPILGPSSEALEAPPSDEFLFDPAVLDALNDIIPATVAPTALWNGPIARQCAHSLKLETSSSRSMTSSSDASSPGFYDETYAPSPSPEYEAMPMISVAQTGEYSRQRHPETYSAYSLDSVGHPATQQTLASQIPDDRLLFYLERVNLAPRLRGRGARGGAASYICRWPGCTWPRFSRRDHAKNHIAAHMNIKPHRCPKCPRAFLRPFDLKRHGRSCRRSWVENESFDHD